MRNICLVLTTLASLGLSSPAYAAPITFFGFDNNLSGSVPMSSHPNSDAARNAFLASLMPGTVGVQNFESLPLGFLPPAGLSIGFPPLALTATLKDPDNNSRILGVTHPGGTFPISGSRYLASFSFSAPQTYFSLEFSSPQKALGFYGMDFSDYFGGPPVPNKSIQIILENSTTSTTLSILNGIDINTIRSGSVHFFGVIDVDRPFTRVTIRGPSEGDLAYDGFGVDDLIIGQPLVPEPTSLMLFGIGTVALYALGWQRRKGHAVCAKSRQAT